MISIILRMIVSLMKFTLLKKFFISTKKLNDLNVIKTKKKNDDNSVEINLE